MLITRRRLLLASGALLLSGCAAMRSDFETPSVSLESFRVVPNQGVTPRFALGLRVVNPNPASLPLRGMSYAVDFEGHQLITGVASDLETIPAFGESRFEVEAGLDLINSLRLLNDLMARADRDHLNYKVRARLDAGGFSRLITMEETGQIPISALSGRPAPR
ncbi:LEA type 2 family protein [Ectothiorhodospira variabilis]|uniref:LEA type 2 family protein n=1 Tax=Ectothiorhodospira variabilis TaxID=505694 RepID=UPI001EFA78E1|nr:LEA type 2 family protein [Ectothiorhodospira variabilis]MCG5495588.1 LEA type 2 family protein [Ectothiorhodospira variabilis]MCG5498374.1 LEA type 2 family protein [Ectothiorhodospira variabilis]MCG5503056.1 LEA type 2 family protein [Ectothiorhodospira variabilis]MCG5506185.1 LEA type 2 family protein [Ectothiorhodospira variabilis]